MSVFVCGKIQLDTIDDLELLQLRELAFEWQGYANEHKLGFVLGAYAKNAQTIIEENKDSFLFEITDAPFEETAETLFCPDGIEIDGTKQPCSLEERIRLIELFLNKVFSSKKVLSVTLFVNYMLESADSIQCIGLSQFLSSISNEYKKSNGYTPSVAYTIHR